MGLFSKPKIPKIDTGALTRLAEQNANTQRDLLGRKKLSLQPMTDKFRTDREALSGQIEPGSENILQKYGQELQGIGQQEKAANDQAIVAQRQQAFRNVPELQRSIRESLGGSGLLRSGGALGSLARPIVDANRSAADFSSALEQNRLGNETRRSEGLASTGFNSRQAALAQRLGFDENTLNSLANMGRADLIDEFNSLAGIEKDLGDSRLNIEQTRQANDIARAQASAARRGALMSTIGSLAGAGVGALTGSPMGIGLGSQLGGSLGGLAGGANAQPIDPTLLVSLLGRMPQRNTAMVGGRTVPVRPY